MISLPLAVRDATTSVRWSLTDRGLVCRVRPTWVGTRPYTTTDGRVVRVLRRPSQVNSPGHQETIKRVTGTRRHPERDGKPVFLSALAEPGSPAPWDPSVELRPPRDYFAAHVGDAIEIVRVPGLGEVPELEATLADAELIADVRQRGLVEVSFGYVSFFVAAADVPVDGSEVVGVGKWRNPETGAVEDFDVEGLCDPADPRVPDDLRPHIGGNHLAFAVPRGRGGPQVRVMLDAADAVEPYAQGDVVEVLVDHMPGMKGMQATVAFVAQEPVYALTMPDGSVHKWAAHSEVRLTRADRPAAAPGRADSLPVLNRNVRAWALNRKVDESGASGVGLVAIAVEVEDGPCAAVWATPTASGAAYDSLATFAAIHVGSHAEGANELVPLALGVPFEAPRPVTPPSAERTEPAITPETPPEPEPEEDAMPTETPPPTQTPPPAAPTAEQLTAKLTEMTAACEALQKRNQELEALVATLKGEKQTAEQTAATATESASAMQAKVDALVEELGPHREAALNASRAAGCDALGVAIDSEHGKLITAATADGLDRAIVDSYYKLHPEAATNTADLARKLGDPAWVRARADLIREGQSPRSTGGVSDAFRSSFPAPATPTNKPTSAQDRLDALQNGKN